MALSAMQKLFAATSGPGGIHLLNGLYDAKCDGQPVLAITGHTFHDLIGTHYQQDVDLDKLFMDVAVYNSASLAHTPIAWERERYARTAGLRTFPLVAVAGCGYIYSRRVSSAKIAKAPLGWSRV